MRPIPPAAAAAQREAREVVRLREEESSAPAVAAGDLPPVPDEGAAADRTDCATAILLEGKPAQTKREVMEKSKADKQYGMGITETKDANKPGNLVDSAKYWESRCAFVKKFISSDS